MPSRQSPIRPVSGAPKNSTVNADGLICRGGRRAQVPTRKTPRIGWRGLVGGVRVADDERLNPCAGNASGVRYAPRFALLLDDLLNTRRRNWRLTRRAYLSVRALRCNCQHNHIISDGFMETIHNRDDNTQLIYIQPLTTTSKRL
jgi:hypothetical protein